MQMKVSFVGACRQDDLYSDMLPLVPLTASLPLASERTPSAVVYFRVSSLSPELSPPGHDSQLGLCAQAGELGCIVDPSVSKMVQTGVENVRVANVDGYLGIGRSFSRFLDKLLRYDLTIVRASASLREASDTPPCPGSSSGSSETETALAKSSSAYGNLLSLVQATLLPHAADYGLHLSVLLQGARGCGKRTVARWVAQKTGVHLLEVRIWTPASKRLKRFNPILNAPTEF